MEQVYFISLSGRANPQALALPDYLTTTNVDVVPTTQGYYAQRGSVGVGTCPASVSYLATALLGSGKRRKGRRARYHTPAYMSRLGKLSLDVAIAKTQRAGSLFSRGLPLMPTQTPEEHPSGQEQCEGLPNMNQRPVTFLAS